MITSSRLPALEVFTVRCFGEIPRGTYAALLVLAHPDMSFEMPSVTPSALPVSARDRRAWRSGHRDGQVVIYVFDRNPNDAQRREIEAALGARELDASWIVADGTV